MTSCAFSERIIYIFFLYLATFLKYPHGRDISAIRHKISRTNRQRSHIITGRERGAEGVPHLPISIVRPQPYPRLSSSARVAVRKSGQMLCTFIPGERGHAGTHRCEPEASCSVVVKSRFQMFPLSCLWEDNSFSAMLYPFPPPVFGDQSPRNLRSY